MRTNKRKKKSLSLKHNRKNLNRGITLFKPNLYYPYYRVSFSLGGGKQRAVYTKCFQQAVAIYKEWFRRVSGVEWDGEYDEAALYA